MIRLCHVNALGGATLGAFGMGNEQDGHKLEGSEFDRKMHELKSGLAPRFLVRSLAERGSWCARHRPWVQDLTSKECQTELSASGIIAPRGIRPTLICKRSTFLTVATGSLGAFDTERRDGSKLLNRGGESCPNSASQCVGP